ncbi:MAG: nitrous oxide reductase family maturation protein NosD [bacterium]|nr:nitrous oxide reductase family maturation protein NosD [bacterium]
MKSRLLIFIILVSTSVPLFAGSPLQLFVDLTSPGQTLNLIPGTFEGNLQINKPIIVDGLNEVTIDGSGKGTVLSINADGVTVRNLHITNSGNSHDKVDAGVMINGNNVVFENCVIDDVLFGVHIFQGNDNIVRNNTISSRPVQPTLRGDGIRLWYSMGNRVENNKLFCVRDMILTNSPNNFIIDNNIQNSRMGLELIFSHGVEAAGNHMSNNEHGIIGIYSDSLHIHHNRIEHQNHLVGSGIAVKSSSQTVIEANEILDCAIGMTANSPLFPENVLYIRDNIFAYNDVAMYFYGEKGGHQISGNQFASNFTDIAVTGPTSALSNNWSGNYWSDYAGFDLDGDGYGDTPYPKFIYSDRIWMDRPMAKFFRGSLVMDLIDFVERLLPYSQPDLILSDPTPLIPAKGE